MPGPAEEILARFRDVETDQRYTDLIEVFADDAIYVDPFYGAQVGRQAIAKFLGHMERVVPQSGLRFEDWRFEADRVCGWARWTMAGPDPSGQRVAVRGQSLYRLSLDGRVTYVADYLDPLAMARQNPAAPAPDLAIAAGLSAPLAPAGDYPARDVVERFWQIQDAGDYAALGPLFADDAVFTDLIYGEFHGGEAISAYFAQMNTEMPDNGIVFELVDLAGDETVAWSQWNCRFPNGAVPGWTLYRVRDGRLTLDADYFDTRAARALTG